MILGNLYIAGAENEAKDIKIENDIISDIVPSDSSNKFHGERALNFKDCIAFPGFINSHDHLEFNLYPQLGHKTYEDYVEWGNDIHVKDKKIIDSIEAVPVHLRMQYGITKNLLCGVTTVAHHGAYHSCFEGAPISVMQNSTSLHSVRLGGKWKVKLTLSKKKEPYVIHTGEGLNVRSFEEINELIRWNILRRKIIGVHAIAMNTEQSKNFQAIVWCPVSNLFLFNKTADINSLKKNTKILFGSDSTLTADWNFFEHLRIARALNQLNDEELFASVTETPAEVWGMHNCGKITKDYTADIVIARQKSDNVFESLFQSNPEDIMMILKKGKIVLYDGSIKETLTDQIKYATGFEPVSIFGKTKFADLKINQIKEEIKKYIFNVPEIKLF